MSTAEEPGSADAPGSTENHEPDGLTLVALIAHDGVEPPAGLSDDDARAAWVAVSSLWHPALLARAKALPGTESVGGPSPPGAGEVRLVAGNQSERLPSGYRTQAEDAGAVLLDGGGDRDATVAALLTRVAGESGEVSEELANVARDFLALGTAAWLIRDLAAAMSHPDAVDRENLTREALAGAKAWASGDANAARNRLRAAFELLTQARERFYPIDSYVADVCLLDPSTPAGAFDDALDARTPVTFLAQANAIEAQAARDPGGVARLRGAIGEGWADVAGGTYDEADDPLLPVGSILWRFRRGGEVYRDHLDGRNVETYARRRFGLYTMLPQVAKRFAFRFGLHMGFDAGRFPVRSESKRLWASPDHNNLEALTRPPVAADRPSAGLQLPWRLAASMRDDHVATLPMVHWPSPLAGWYLDLRRVASYSPVLGRWVTLNDYFHLTDRPYETFSAEPDEYVTPYLAQAVAREDDRPVSRRAEHARLRARFDALGTVRATAGALSASLGGQDVDLRALENTLETGGLVEAAAALDALEPLWAGALARAVGGGGAGGRPGFLVVNPVGIPRRVAVPLPDAAPDLRPEGPLRAAQLTDEGVYAVVEVPAFGFAWVPRDTNFEASPAPLANLSVRGSVLSNESVTVEVDPATGGVRGLKGADEATARLGQQLVVEGLPGGVGKAPTTRMRCERFEVEYGGPALVQAVSEGTIDTPEGRPLAQYRQRYRLWTGRPLLEVDVTLSDLDPAWIASLGGADPWSSYLACRWAWPDATATLRRTSLLAPSPTEADRPETPDALDVSTRRQRTALLFGGLAHHRRHGSRMLDTILLAGRESCRTFRLGVALDLEYPFHASADLVAPAFAVPTEAGPPKAGPAGWLFHTDQKGVAVTGVERVGPGEDGRGWGLAFFLLETTGRPCRCRLRLFRDPTWARQTDFQNEVIVDLPVDGDSVLVDFTPHEFARVEVTLG